MSIPDEYAEIHRELEKAILNPKDLSNDEKEETLNGLTEDLSKPSSESELLREIDSLAGAALEVDGSFDKIMSIFRDIRRMDIRDDLRKDVITLENTWDGHHKKFTQLLWESRQVAGKAQAAADEFAGDFSHFLADDDTSIEDKKLEIASYMEKLTRDEEAARQMSDGFTDLKKGVEEFQVEWGRVVKKYNLDVIAKNIAQLDAAIAQLEMTLVDLDNKIKALAISLGVLSAAGGVSAALGFICPLFWIGTLFSVVGVGISAGLLIKAQNEKKDVVSSLGSKRAERATEAGTLQAVKKLKAGLDESQNDFNTICTRLGAFARVWATLRADIQQIEEKLDYVKISETKGLFKARIKTAAKLYATLGKALYRYQIVVDKNQILSSKFAV